MHTHSIQNIQMNSQSSELQQIQLSPWKDFREHLEWTELVSINIGPAEELYLLLLTFGPFQYREEIGHGIFDRIHPADLLNFRIVQVDGEGSTSFEITRQYWNYHHVQPLPDEELLLACARSSYRGPNDYDLNAKVFSHSDSLKREFLLGDGILDVQTTADGRIWTSYFDEGVHGNYGWGGLHGPRPVGHMGLVLWNKFGKKLYEYSPPAGLEYISDCLALNVVDDNETWFIGSPLVRLRGKEEYAFWNTPEDIEVRSAFAIWDKYALFCSENRHQLVELLDDHTMKLLATYQFVDEQGEVLKFRHNVTHIVARGRLIFLMGKTSCYRVDLAELL